MRIKFFDLDRDAKSKILYRYTVDVPLYEAKIFIARLKCYENIRRISLSILEEITRNLN